MRDIDYSRTALQQALRLRLQDLAFGGGSSLDSAKIIALAAANNMSVKACMGFAKAKLPPLPLFAVPTTAGTGSEATMAAIVSDDDTHAKQAVADFKLVPAAAALDPALMLGLPPHITAATGMDALTHAIESYTGVWNTPETDQYGLAATKLIFENIETAYNNGQDMAARRSHISLTRWIRRRASVHREKTWGTSRRTASLDRAAACAPLLEAAPRCPSPFPCPLR